MINLFKCIGECVLRKIGYYDTDDIIEKRKLFLDTQSIVPHSNRQLVIGDPKSDKITNANAIDFDIDNKTFNFVLDKELCVDNREYFFAFSSKNPRDKRKFLSTNYMDIFYNKVITDSLNYIFSRKNNKSSKEWFSENISEDYYNLLQNIRDIFYIDIKDEYVLNKECIHPDLKEYALQIEETYLKKYNREIPLNILYNSLLNKLFNKGLYNKNKDLFSPISMIKINGRHILEYENYKSSYINIVYYDLIERFFVEGKELDKICHICCEQKMIIGNIPLPMKFYGSSNELYFEDLISSRSYKSFSICRNCLIKVLTGMNYVHNNLKDYLFGNNYYIIPELDNIEPNFYKKYKKFTNLVKSNKGYMDHINSINGLLLRSNKNNFRFNLLFFNKVESSAAFNVVKYITNIDYKYVSEKLKMFDIYNKKYKFSLINEYYTMSLYNIIYYLFPTKNSHNKVNIDYLRKDIINILENFFTGNNINYNEFIKRFMYIYRLRFNRDKIEESSPFKMVILLSIFNNMKGVNMEDIGKSITDVSNESYKEFFDTHDIVYKNKYRQGLFLLGTIINDIVYAQQKKNSWKMKNSSTFLGKLDYNGIPSRRVNKLILDVKNYTQIYDIYEDNLLWAQIFDRLQGIENSSMTNEDIIFYILTGISFNKYLGSMKSLNKKEENND